MTLKVLLILYELWMVSKADFRLNILFWVQTAFSIHCEVVRQIKTFSGPQIWSLRILWPILVLFVLT